MWIPEEDPEFAGILAVNGDKALKTGLFYRPIEETIEDTLAWAKTRPDGYEMRAGISRQREVELIKLWKAQLST